MRTERRCRRFRLLDAMILVAAAAVGAALVRAFLNSGYETTRFFGPDGREDWIAGRYHIKEFGAIVLGTATLAVLVLRFLPPRPGLRRVFRQPGTAGMIAVVVTSLADAVFGEIINLRSPSSLDWPQYSDILALRGGPTVAAVWLTLWLTRARRPEPGWIDRLGRAVGFGWIALYASWFTTTLF